MPLGKRAEPILGLFDHGQHRSLKPAASAPPPSAAGRRRACLAGYAGKNIRGAIFSRAAGRQVIGDEQALMTTILRGQSARFTANRKQQLCRLLGAARCARLMA